MKIKKKNKDVGMLAEFVFFRLISFFFPDVCHVIDFFFFVKSKQLLLSNIPSVILRVLQDLIFGFSPYTILTLYPNL